MAIPRYLAITAEEIAGYAEMPANCAWMLCPFSFEDPSPFRLAPTDSVIVLTDSTPVRSELADMLIGQLLSLNCTAVLLDFQRQRSAEAAALSKCLIQGLPCPVVVTQAYASELDCPVFLPPVPLHQRLTDHIAPWKDRDIWLDISTEGERITLTEQGSATEILYRFQGKEKFHQDNRLHCHYSIAVSEEKAEFSLWRTREDLAELIKDAENCGIAAAVGLFQELNAL